MLGSTTLRLDGVLIAFLIVGALFARRFVAFFSESAGIVVVLVVLVLAFLARLRISPDGELAVRSILPWWRRVSLAQATRLRFFERISGQQIGRNRPLHHAMEYRTLVCEVTDMRGRRVRFYPGAYHDPDGSLRAALQRAGEQAAAVEGGELFGIPREG